MNGRNDATTFLPLAIKGGPCISNSSKHISPSSEDIVKITFSKANKGTEMNKQYSSNETTKDLEVNSYKEAILKEPNKNKDQIPMEEWSILSDHVKYVMHSKSEVFQKLSINSMSSRQNRDLYKSLNKEQTIKTNLNFRNCQENLKPEYLDMNEGVYVEVISTDKFDEDTDISTTYLGQVDMTRNTEVKAEENFPVTTRGYTRGQLLDGTDCDVLIDTGASKSYMSKSYFLQCKLLHAMPKFTSSTKRIQVGNGQYVGVLFVIPVIITIQSHRFEIFTLVLEIHENVDLVLGIKNLFELEGVIDSQNSCFSFLNRSLPFFLKEKVEVKPKEQKIMVLEAPFEEEITGMAITKLLNTKEQMTLTMKIKFIRNRATFKVKNDMHETCDI